MSVTIDLAPDVLARLHAEAGRRGVSIGEVIAELASSLPAAQRPRQALSFIALGSSTSGRTARETDDVLAEGFGRD